MAEYDGSIRINTKIETSGIKKDVAEIQKEIENLKDAQKSFLEAGGSKTSPIYAEYTKSLEKAQKELEALENTQRDIESRDEHWNLLKVDVEEYAKALKELESQGKYFGDEDFDQVYLAWRNASDAVKAYRNELNQQSAAAREVLNEQAAEENRLSEIKNNATVSDEKMVALLEKRKALADQLKNLEKAGVGEGYEEYDQTYIAWKNATEALKEYQAQLNQQTEAGQAKAAEKARVEAEKRAETQRKIEEQAEKALQKENARIQKEIENESKLQAKEAERQAKIEAEAAEEERLAEIRNNAVVNNQHIIDVLERRKQLLAEIKDLEAAGVTAGYQDYDSKQQELAAINSEIKDYSNSVNKTKESYKKLGNTAKKSMEKAGKCIKKSNGLLSAMFSRLKKLAISMFIFNQISKAFRAMISGMKEGFQNLYTENANLKGMVDNLKASFSTLKNSIAAAFRPLVEMAIPYIQRAVDYLTRLFDLFGQFAAAVTGQKKYTKAVKQTADALEDESEASNKQLSSLDKLNTLSSGSADANSGTSGTMFEEVPISNKFKDVSQRFENMQKKVEPFTNALKRFWDGGLSKLSSFTATGLKDFYESFLKPLSTWAFGTEDKGFTRLVNIINEDLCGVDWDTINRNLKDFWEAIEPYAEEFGEGLIDFFEWISDQSFLGLEKLFGEDGLLVDFTDWLNNHDPKSARDWAHALTTLFSALFLFKLLKPGISIISKLVELFTGKKLSSVLTKGISGALTSLGGFSGLMTTDLATIFGAGTATEIGVTIGTGLIGGILAAVGGFELGKELGKLLFPEDAEWYDNFHWMGEGGFFDTISADWETSLAALDEMGTAIQNNKVVQFLSGDIYGLLGKEHKTWADTKKDFEDFKDSVSEKWDGMKNWFEGDVKPYFASDKWKGMWGVLRDTAKGKWGEFCNWWNGSTLVKWWSEDVSPWFAKEKWIGAMTGIKDGFKESFKNACNAGIEIFNRFIGWLNDKLNFSWDGLTLLGKEIYPAGSVKLFTIPQIPKLATGTVVPPNKEFMAVLGDNKKEPEIVSPISTMKQALGEVLLEAIQAGLIGGNNQSGDIVVEIDSREVFRATQKQAREYKKQTGSPAFG